MALKKPVTAEPESKPKETPAKVVTTKKPVSPLWWIAGTLLFVVTLIFILGAVKHAMYAYSDNVRFDNRGGHMMDLRDMRESMRDMKSNVVSGVVTAIDGDMLTVAGNGTTQQIKTTDTTEYYGAAQPVKVNDSVRLMGTTTNDVFTATRVIISRQ